MPEFNFSGLSALVVEDTKEARRGYVATLAAHGFEVDEADGLNSALEAVKCRMYDMAWVDLSLKGARNPADRSGMNVVRQIRIQNDRTFVVIVTVNDEADTAMELVKDVGADDFITKDSLTLRPISSMLLRIKKGLDRYQNLKYDVLNEARTTFFGDLQEFEFVDLINKQSGKKIPPSMKLINSLIDNVFKKYAPLTRTSNFKGQLTMSNDGVIGEYWSRAVGYPIKIRFGDIEAPDLFGDLLFCQQRGKLKVDVFKIPGNRSEFGE